MFEDRELVAEFVNESREHLADIEGQLLGIEEGGAQADPALVNEVFRSVHSIKGAAGFMGFTKLGKLAHELENVLNLVRNRELVPTSPIIDAMLKAADKLRELINDIENSNEAEIGDHLDALERIIAGLLEQDAPAKEQPSAKSARQRKSAAAKGETEAQPQGAAPLIETRPEAAAAEIPQTARGGEVKPQAAAVPRCACPAAPRDTATPSSQGPVADATIRVHVGILDRMMTLAGELVLARNQLLQTIGCRDAAKLDAVSGRVDQVTTDIHETVMQARMQVVGTVFNRFPRVVRDLSNQLGKQCELKIEGAEVEIDKSIIEAIGDPLTHLVRNAIDHGIEAPDERRAAGKPAQAAVLLRAFHQAGKVNITISDDGRGIDAAKVKQKAVARGLLTQEHSQTMSQREALGLIFRPGFSLAEKVTAVSGRGVGMDVVKTNIERVGGSVSVETEIGRGTTVHVRLPLTLAIIPSLIVRCGGNRYAIPQSSISELVRVKAIEAAGNIQRIKDAEVLRLRGELLPLVRLDTVLGRSAAENEQVERSAENIVVAELGHLRFGLVVDGLHDSEEIVVKPLGRHMRDCSWLAGATVLGDGQAALILDPAGVAAFAKLRTLEDESSPAGAEADSAVSSDRQTLLLFQNDPAEQFAVPMQLVARLERVRTAQIDSVGGSKVLQYRGGTLPLLSLEDTIHARPIPETPWLCVVVFAIAGREAGLLIREVVDIHATDAKIDGTLFREPGVIGSLVVDGRTTRLLDLHELTTAAHPDWKLEVSMTASTEAAGAQRAGSATILLAEDSDFFRARMTEILEKAGCRVMAYPDGAAAWTAIQDPVNSFDMVVTDLEMPHVDGFELVRRVRQLPSAAQVPVFAVSSLASEEDQRRAREAGVDEYHIKLDRESLVTAVMTRLGRAAGTTPAQAE